MGCGDGPPQASSIKNPDTLHNCGCDFEVASTSTDITTDGPANRLALQLAQQLWTEVCKFADLAYSREKAYQKAKDSDLDMHERKNSCTVECEKKL